MPHLQGQVLLDLINFVPLFFISDELTRSCNYINGGENNTTIKVSLRFKLNGSKIACQLILNLLQNGTCCHLKPYCSRYVSVTFYNKFNYISETYILLQRITCCPIKFYKSILSMVGQILLNSYMLGSNPTGKWLKH